jgi:hypothetical protein
MPRLFQNMVGPPKDSKIYVWSSRENKKSKTKAVISAHGGKTFINGMATAPPCRLAYYSPHGDPLNDPGLEKVLARLVEPYEWIESRQSQDYDLSKYTNTNKDTKDHNKNNESYESVGAIADMFAGKHEDFRLMNEAAQGPRGTAQMRATAAFYEERYREFGMDIITIRHRRFQSDPKLSWVLQTLWAYGYDYEEVHCSFCRGFFGGYTAKAITPPTV